MRKIVTTYSGGRTYIEEFTGQYYIEKVDFDEHYFGDLYELVNEITINEDGIKQQITCLYDNYGKWEVVEKERIADTITIEDVVYLKFTESMALLFGGDNEIN